MEKLEELRQNLPLILSDERPDIDPKRLIGVGLVGAISAMALYYFYNMLHQDTRDKLKDQLVSLVKGGIQKIALD